MKVIDEAKFKQIVAHIKFRLNRPDRVIDFNNDKEVSLRLHDEIYTVIEPNSSKLIKILKKDGFMLRITESYGIHHLKVKLIKKEN